MWHLHIFHLKNIHSNPKERSFDLKEAFVTAAESRSIKFHVYWISRIKRTSTSNVNREF